MDIGIHCHRFPIGEQGGLASPAPIGLAYTSVRTHDGNVQWRDLNPARGVYNWARMDAIVAAHPGKSIVYTIYGTPAFAVLHLADAMHLDNWGSPGGAAPANQADISAFSTALLTRYKGKLKAIEIWNEPQFKGYVSGSFFWGTAEELVSMGVAVRSAVDVIDPSVEVWSPGFDTPGALTEWLGAGSVATGSSIIDKVCWHSYGCWLLNDGSNIITGSSGVQMVRNVMSGVGITHKKIVISEYGIDGVISGARLAAYNAMNDSQRYSYWYAMLCALRGAGVAGFYLYAWDQNLCGDLINDVQGIRRAINDMATI